MLTGYIDRLDRHFLAGWAAETEYPNAHVEIIVIVDGLEWGRVSANAPRLDLKEHGSYGDGRHGFTYLFDKPMSALNTYNISVMGNYDSQSSLLAQKTIGKLFPNIKQKEPILVTASGRSGTTILMDYLNSSTSIVIHDKYPYELKLLTYYCKAFDILSSPGNRGGSMKDDGMYLDPHQLGLNPFNHHEFQDVFLDTTTIYDFFERRAPQKLAAAFKSIVSDFYDLLAERSDQHDGLYFAEKCDILHPTRDFARFIFGRVKEIILIRDPRDVFCSYRSFWKSRPEEAIQALKDTAEKTLEILQYQDCRETIYIKYEDLIFRKSEVLQKISEFLELEHPLTPNVVLEADLFRKHGTSKDASSSVGRWKKEMSAAEVKIFSTQFADFFVAFDYEHSLRSKSATHWTAFHPIKT